jgi:hypothetical protein
VGTFRNDGMGIGPGVRGDLTEMSWKQKDRNPAIGLRPRDRRWSPRQTHDATTYCPVSLRRGRQGIHSAIGREWSVTGALYPSTMGNV